MTHPIRATRRVLFAALCCAGCATAASAATPAAMATHPAASDTAATTSSKVPAADRKFVHEAAIGGMAEVELGKLAQQKAANDQVKQFGARMVEDHGKANDKLKTIASRQGIEIPSELDHTHKSEMNSLEKLDGAQFDKAYMSQMLKDHKHDIAAFKKEASSGKDPDVKAFAADTLPTLEEHLKLAEETNAALKK